MARDLTAAMVTEVTAPSLRPFFLVELEFDSATTRLWTGVGDLVWNGNTYLGAGHVLAASALEETSEVRATGLVGELSGVPASMLALALTEAYQGRAATVRIGALDAAGAVVATPYAWFTGFMDVMEIDEAGATATIRLSLENHLVALERTRERHYTPEDQALDYPPAGSPLERDAMFDQVALLQNLQIEWGGG